MEENNITFMDAMEGKQQPSLKAIADIFEVPPQRIYSVAKQPIAGEVYDARVYNWAAINKFIEKRIGKEGDKFANMQEVYDAAIAHDVELASADRRRQPREGSGRATISVGDKQIPARRKEVAVGDVLYLKKCDGAFTVVYLTETHVVLQAENSPELTCLGNRTFNQRLTNAPAVATTAEADADAE